MNSFMECGWAAWIVLLLAIVAVAGGVVAIGLAILKPKWGLAIGLLAVGLAVLVPAAGVLGTLQGRNVVDGAISGHSVDPSMHEKIRTAGYAEAATCTSLGLTFGALPGLLSVAAIGVAAVRRKARPAG